MGGKEPPERRPTVVVLAYITYGVLVFLLAAMARTVFDAMMSRANPIFARPGFIATACLVVGVPCYFVASYLREHGDESISLLVLVIAASVGLLLGTGNRA
jgi:hypothetical protein